MNPEIFALAVTTAVFAGGAVGLILQRSLPEKYTSGGPRTSPYSRLFRVSSEPIEQVLDYMNKKS